MQQKLPIRHCGIIIHSGMPYRPTVTLFDSRLGLIKSTALRELIIHRLHHGMLIEYEAQEKGDRYALQGINLVAVPAAWVCEDLDFFHAVLLLIDELVFCGKPQSDLFDLLSLLCKDIEFVHMPSFVKKWFICRLFLLLDFYPSEEHTCSIHLFNLISSPFDIMVKLGCERVTDEKEFSWWLRGCVQANQEFLGKYRTPLF